jgi:hypothetical protein
MAIYPQSPRETVFSWMNARIDVWKTNADAIGLTQAQVNTLQTLLDEAEVTAQAQVTAKAAAKTATQIAGEDFTSFRRELAAMVAVIRAKAQASGDLSIYDTALLPRPAAPSQMPPPGQPTDLRVTLAAATGQITINWKSTNPPNAAGTTYIVRRKLPNQASFEFIGVTGAKKFVDGTLTAGPDFVQYTVQGQRADSTGPTSDVFTVNFGRAPNGALTAYVTNDTTQRAPKLAA